MLALSSSVYNPFYFQSIAYFKCPHNPEKKHRKNTYPCKSKLLIVHLQNVLILFTLYKKLGNTNSCNATILLEDALDFEEQPKHQVVLRVTVNGVKVVKSLDVTVLDVNDAPEVNICLSLYCS